MGGRAACRGGARRPALPGSPGNGWSRKFGVRRDAAASIPLAAGRNGCAESCSIFPQAKKPCYRHLSSRLSWPPRCHLRRAIATAWHSACASGLCALFLGFAAAAWRTAQVAAPVLERPKVGKFTGYVESCRDPDFQRAPSHPDGWIDGLAPSRCHFGSGSPYRAALAWRRVIAISAVARLLPPPEPSRPGGYDFAREAYFMRHRRRRVDLGAGHGLGRRLSHRPGILARPPRP